MLHPCYNADFSSTKNINIPQGLYRARSGFYVLRRTVNGSHELIHFWWQLGHMELEIMSWLQAIDNEGSLE